MTTQVSGGLAAQQNTQQTLNAQASNIALIRANNFINDQPIILFARRLAARIPDTLVRTRFAHVAYGVLRADPRNACEPSPEDMEDAPEWAIVVTGSGRRVHKFIAHPDSVAPVRETARNLRETWLEFSYFQNTPRSLKTAHDIVMWQTSREFLMKISRMPFDVIAHKAAYFAHARKRRLDALSDDQNPFSPEEIYTAPGRSWRRVRSVEELAKLGDELENCLAAGSRQHKGFARRFRADTARFWALRDHMGAALMAAMVDSVSGRILDVRGPRNAHVRRNDPDLAVLMRARNLGLSPSVFLIPFD